MDVRAATPAPALPDPRPQDAPADFHVLAKPSGPICNLDCTYCFFLSKEALYPGDRFRMSGDVLDAYLRQVIESQTGPEVEIAWQGGEPTLMGVEFFRDALRRANEYRRPGQALRHAIQTNGTLLTEEWCELFRNHSFLVGISLDGPRELHNTFRVDKHGEPTFDRVMRGVELLRASNVDFNVLCTVNAANQEHPLDVYRFFRDEIDVRHVQLIPIVERDNGTGFQEGNTVTARSVDPVRWGDFLIGIFDEWIRHDVGSMFVSMFDAALASWLGLPAGMCIFSETCGNAVALEHNGDLHACDHYVEPRYLLGNITETHMLEFLADPRQRAFGAAKRDTLPRWCRECTVRFACNGECPKNRFMTTPDGEDGLNWLCAGYKAFFEYVDGPMRLMADLLRQGRHADEVMRILAKAPRNSPCPCGSGRKAKLCHAT